MEWRGHMEGGIVRGTAGESFWKEVLYARAGRSLRMNAVHRRLMLRQLNP